MGLFHSVSEVVTPEGPRMLSGVPRVQAMNAFERLIAGRSQRFPGVGMTDLRKQKRVG